jgi:transcription antitermination factor NusG
MTTYMPPSADSDGVRRWYALYLQPRREFSVSKQLSLRQLDHYLPLYHVIHKWKNRCTKHLDLPLFPGYLFVRLSTEQRVSVLSVPGVVQLVGRPGRPSPLPDDEIEALRGGLKDRNPQPHPPLTEGERVRIRSGALAGMVGTLQRSSDGPRVVITLDLIAQGASVEVDWNEVEPVGADSRLVSTRQNADDKHCSTVEAGMANRLLHSSIEPVPQIP